MINKHILKLAKKKKQTILNKRCIVLPLWAINSDLVFQGGGENGWYSQLDFWYRVHNRTSAMP